MGKTSKPLHILVSDDIFEWEEITTLISQGHRIDPGNYPKELDTYDIILGPQCWRMDQDHREYLDLAISEARKVRYPKEGKDDSAD